MKKLEEKFDNKLGDIVLYQTSFRKEAALSACANLTAEVSMKFAEWINEKGYVKYKYSNEWIPEEYEIHCEG